MITFWPRVMGCAPPGERSMIASRRCPKPTRASGAIQASAASGPRLRMHSRVAISSSRSTGGAESRYVKMALMPHIALSVVRCPLSVGRDARTTDNGQQTTSLQCAPMRRLTALLALATTTLLAQSTVDKPILGFTPPNAAKERALEAQFDSKLNRDNLRNWMQRLSARPHHLGSPYDSQNAEFIASLFQSWGYDTAIEEFQVLFPTPRKRLLELIAP